MSYLVQYDFDSGSSWFYRYHGTGPHSYTTRRGIATRIEHVAAAEAIALMTGGRVVSADDDAEREGRKSRG